MRLAGHLGKSLAEILDLDSRELTLWYQYERDHPFHDPYWTAALICQCVVAPHSKKVPKLQDFLPVKPKRKKLTDEQLIAQIAATAHVVYRDRENSNPPANSQKE